MYRMRRFYGGGVFVGKLFAVCLGLSSASAAPREASVDTLFLEWDRPDSPGCALGVIRDGRFAYQRAYGMANLEHDVALSSRSVFRTGSLGKQFTAFAMLLAEQQGKLSMDDDVRKYLPELPPTERPITIRHLIHHTSGLRDYLTLMELGGTRDEDFYTEQDVMDRLVRQESLNFEPGSEYLYSNTGYFLLSQILPRATGLSLAEFSRRHIFEPLGMSDSHFHDDFRRIVKHRASGYRARADDDGFEIDMTTLNMVGDGGVFTTVADLLQWDRNFYSGEVGGEELARKRVVTGRLTDGTVQDYAYGLDVSSYRGRRTVLHGGAFVGFRSAMLQFPEERLAVYVLCNVASAEPTRLARSVAQIFLELGPEPVEAERPSVSVNGSQWTGVYFDDTTGGLAEIELRDAAFYWKEMDQPLVAVAPERFRAGALRVAFLPDTMTVEREGQRSFHYQRMEPVSPGVEVLSRYAGLYRCREFDVAYRIELDENQALVLHGPAVTSPMTPVFEEGFRWRLGTIVFVRDANDEPTAFELSAGRARNFVFERM